MLFSAGCLSIVWGAVIGDLSCGVVELSLVKFVLSTLLLGFMSCGVLGLWGWVGWVYLLALVLFCFVVHSLVVQYLSVD